MNASTPRNGVPAIVTQKLSLVRHRKAWMHFATALAAALAVLLTAMGLAMLVDWLATLYDSPWRMALTAAAIAAGVFTAAGWLVLARRGLSVGNVAADVDRQLPGASERWTTVADVGQLPRDSRRTHPAMYRRVASEAERMAPRVAPEAVVDMSPMLRTLLVLTGVTVALAIAVVLDARQTLVLVQRFWSPRSLASATEISATPAGAVVARGEALKLEAAVTGRLVDEAELVMRTPAGEEKRLELFGRGESPVAFVHHLRDVREPFQYRVRAGDGQTPWHEVAVADRPQIEAVRLVVTPPEYTRRAPAEFGELPRQVSAMVGSRVELAILPKAPVKSLALKLNGDRSVDVPRNDDRWHRWTMELTEDCSLSPLLTEAHGLTNRSAPTCQFTVYPDKAPTVNVLTPDEEMAVQPDDTIEITFSATDDVGISEAELIVYDESSPGSEAAPLATIPIDLGDQAGAATVQRTVALDLNQFAAEDGVSLSYEIRVREDRGGRAPAAKLAALTAAPTKPAPAPPTAPESNAKASPGTLTAGADSTPSESPAKSSEAAETPPTSIAASTPARDGDATGDSDEAGASPKVASAASQPPSSSAAPTGETPMNPAAPAKPEKLAAAENMPPAPGEIAATSAAAASPPSPASPTTDLPTPRDSEKLAEGPSSPASPGAKTAATSAPSSSSSSEQSPANVTPRTAASGRQSLNSAEAPKEMEGDPPADRTAESMAAQAEGTSKAAPNQQTASTGSSASSPASPPTQPSSPSDPPPGDSMTRRSLDVAQSASSQRMRLTVDEWAGSFAGQQRAKLELAISPELEALDAALAKSQRTARGVLDASEQAGQWRDSQQREVAAAEKFVVEAQEIVARLLKQSAGTPYAFVGLQVADVGLAHIDPAKADFWKSLQSDGADRTARLRDAWQHVGRARELVAELRGQYERAKREFQLAEAIERVKKMYQVYIEDSQALLQVQDGDPNRFNRKMVEFDLDDDYLKRLQDVMEMRRDLRAELARILAQDPRLLRRFMDSMRNRSNNLREELAELRAAQEKLNGEVRAWTNAAAPARPRVAQLLALRHLAGAKQLETAAGEFQSRYQTWLSLTSETEDPDLAAASRLVQQAATAASELHASAAAFAASLRSAASPAATASGAAVTDDAAITPSQESDAPVAADHYEATAQDGKSFYELLTKLEVALRQLAAREEGGETTAFAGNRLVEARRLIADASAWIKQAESHQAGQYAAAAEIDQYRFAMATDQLAGKLGSLEQTLAALMQREDGTLPAPIVEKAREFIAMLDKQAMPNQVAAVYSLRTDQLPRAVQRQTLAHEALAEAERLYDELIRLAIEELDKLPVQDPIADLLDDPTLDELLAQLEQEAPLEELLGIPQRPSNLRVVDDWLSGGGDNALASGGGAAQTLMNQLTQDEKETRNRMDKAQRRAVARARKAATRAEIDVPASAKLSDWNQLVSRLGDDLSQGRDKQPPEQYRRAIEQYFAEIARAAAAKSGTSP